MAPSSPDAHYLPRGAPPALPAGHETRSRGYTFLELMVVITLIGIFFFFAIPRLAPDFPSENLRMATNWFALNIPRLKRRAVSEQKTVLLTIAQIDGVLWVSDAAATAESASRERFALPDTVHIREIVSYGRPVPETGTVIIRFSPDGTSDAIMIRLSDDGGREVDIKIVPFLYAAKISETPS